MVAVKLRRIQEAELWGDEMVLEGPGAEDGDVAEAVQRSLETAEHDAVGEAVRMSLESLDGHGTTVGGTSAPSGSAGVTVAAAASSVLGAALPGAASINSVDEQRVRPAQVREPSAPEGLARSARRRVGQQLDLGRPMRRCGALAGGESEELPGAASRSSVAGQRERPAQTREPSAANGVARSARRRVGQQLDLGRPLLRRGALAGDESEELPAALGRMVLSDSEDGGEVNVPARVRRVIRRSESEVSLGHADAELASRVGRVQMSWRETEIASELPRSCGGAAPQPVLVPDAPTLPAATASDVSGLPDQTVGGVAGADCGAAAAGVTGRASGVGRARGRGRAQGRGRVEVVEPRRSTRLAARRGDGFGGV